MSQKNLPDRGDAPSSHAPSSDLLGKFQSPWHAELFALTLSLHKAGQFSWPEWTQYLGKALKEENVPEFEFANKDTNKDANKDAGDDAGDDGYYHAWLTALCTLLCDKQITSNHEIAKMKHRWAEAYSRTPHGQPVSLD